MRCNATRIAAVLCFLAACSGDKQDEPCTPGDDGCPATAEGSGGSAGVSFGGSGGMHAFGSSGSGGASMLHENTLTLELDDAQGMKIQSATLQCGACVDVEAVVHGGNPPYTFAWEDGSEDAKYQVCATASGTVRVSVTDTSIVSDEFPYAEQTVSADLSVTVLGCVDSGIDAGVRNDGGTPGEACDKHASPSSFDPVVKWTWTGGGSMSTPLVANLTDDNEDGVIDLRDTPDVVVVNIDQTSGNSELVVLDGESGAEHYRIPRAQGESTPALGDIDGDREADLVAVLDDFSLAAFHGDGTPIWTSMPGILINREAAEVALADLDHDGTPEIIAGEKVFDAKGEMLWSASVADTGLYTSAIAVDLDDDEDLEVVWGGVAYRYDGAEYYRSTEILSPDPVTSVTNSNGVYAAVADLDGDDAPEIVVSGISRLFVLDHEGNTLRSVAQRATNLPFPPAIADLDGDGTPEIMLSDGVAFIAYTAELEVLWSMPVIDASGIAAGTAFDFLGDGSAEAMYGDEQQSWGFDGVDGHVIFMQPRASNTVVEYPSVADVDNDGSADILIVSNANSTTSPGLQVISDRKARWVPARRILNQEAYSVTNVNEDGTIPRHQKPHWKLNNSFRAQGQVNADGTLCLPKR
jgi:hypothetical protein